MEQDRALLSEVRSGQRSKPVLRFYEWNPPAVSYGYNQDINESVHLQAVKRLGYDIVRRPTGGRALLHKGDLCYAVVARREWHPEFRTLGSTYRAIGGAHRRALGKLGVKSVETRQSLSKPSSPLSPCFAMLNPFEVTVGGRKICGSAQYRSAGAFLQHGSLRVYDIWTQSDLAELWPADIALSRGSVTSLEEELGSRIALAQIADIWSEAFAEVFQVDFDSDTKSE